ncbi:MAG TPA: hypothetical protein VMC81_12810 [Rhodocyclaceae bacterium]|nr:hypothetical protein [Rhodocyclaceae bacterium]
MHEAIDSGKCVLCCLVGVGLAVAASFAALAVVLNVVKRLLF